LQEILKLGNLDSKRDWGYSKDYVEGIWRILQHHEPDDFLLATGETHSVREFVEEVGRNLDMDIVWEGEKINERGIDRKTNKVVVGIDPIYFRPAEVEFLQGDATKARELLGWQPKVIFKDLAKLMAEEDFEIAQKEAKFGKHIEVQRKPV